ncbi:MAG: hypothetical protein JSW41_04870 [Candidatus Aenigmatarchaeota archaeon]|nr:MAG: hypothetical protein JSW41_04870 [Candidatus Aenigmarchaeota archaeon]
MEKRTHKKKILCLKVLLIALVVVSLYAFGMVVYKEGYSDAYDEHHHRGFVEGYMTVLNFDWGALDPPTNDALAYYECPATTSMVIFRVNKSENLFTYPDYPETITIHHPDGDIVCQLLAINNPE